MSARRRIGRVLRRLANRIDPPRKPLTIVGNGTLTADELWREVGWALTTGGKS